MKIRLEVVEDKNRHYLKHYRRLKNIDRVDCVFFVYIVINSIPLPDILNTGKLPLKLTRKEKEYTQYFVETKRLLLVLYRVYRAFPGRLDRIEISKPHIEEYNFKVLIMESEYLANTFQSSK